LDVLQAVKKRRAYRALTPVPITQKLIEDLTGCARLAPSCFNNQPWRFVFVFDPLKLEEMRSALSEGNRWAFGASLIIVVFSRSEDDCVIRDRKYHQFDCGLAAGFLILRATELGLVAHPIAGFSPRKTRKILGIPGEFEVVTLIVVGQKTEKNLSMLTEEQVRREKRRPRRKRLEEILFLNGCPAGKI
jgi:nitroreductase